MLPAILINLDRSRDRLAHMEAEFARVDVGFSRLSGTDTRSWTAEEADDFFRNRSFSPQERLPGDAGAFLSHRSAWRQNADGNSRAVAVFEDDVHLANDVKALLRAAD